MEKQDVFLESKIETPTASRNFIVRERLIQRLNDAEERLIIVSAGMGYGKTVLLTHYAKRYPEKCAWYHLSDTDNDIMVFARYLSKAIKKVAGDFELDFSPYQSLDQNEAMVRNLALDFAVGCRELGERELCLVLDDFQEIESEWIFRFLNILWDNDPGGLRIFLCTKGSVPPFCARYLLREEASVLGAENLAFNADEIRQMIRDYVAPEKLDGVTRAILVRMEGWPAGVGFVALYFRQRRVKIEEQDIEQACQQSYLRDYLMHELYRKLPFELQHFLTYTSILDYLRPDVCNVLAGVENAAGLLSYLEQENLFILRLSGGGRIYRYHSLFRSFLLSQLQASLRQSLLEQAASFYLRTRDKAQAAEYAIACGDGGCLQSAVETAGREALSRGQLGTLSRWLGELKRLGTVPSPEIHLIRAKYSERIGDWQAALDEVGEIPPLGSDGVGELCWIEAKLLRARVIRDQVSTQKSLEALDEIWPRLLPERGPLRELRRQATELRVRDLLDLNRAQEALAIVLSAQEEAVRCREEEETAHMRELAIACYCSMGEYRRAMQAYVVLCSHGSSAGAAGYINLYLALTDRSQKLHNRMWHEQERQLEDIPRYRLEEFFLIRMLTERIEQMNGLEPPLEGEGKRLPDPWALSEGERAPRLNQFGFALRRALLPEPLQEAEEDALFRVKDSRFSTAQDGARWLAIRRRVQNGERERARELCRRAGGGGIFAAGGDISSRRNAFTAFIALESALLLLQEDAKTAEDLARRWAPYLADNRLRCPGLSARESAALDGLFSACGAGMGHADISREEEIAPPQKLKIYCFGKLRVILPDGEELRWRTRKAEELFAYLFHLQGVSADRERLLDILWPQSAPSNATSLLHTSLYSIRKSLTPFGLDGLLQRDKRGYRMDMDLVECPLTRVEELCRDPEEKREDARTLELYEGPYLEDIEAQWAADSRAWYAGGFLKACRMMAEERMGQGDFRTAAECLRAAVRQEPYDELLSAMLIRCYAAMGEVKNAMAQYKNLKETLEEDLGAEPGGEVTRIYKECLLRRLESRRSS